MDTSHADLEPGEWGNKGMGMRSPLLRRERHRALPLGVALRLFISALLLAALAPSAAKAVTDAEELTRFGAEGSGAGQMIRPRQVATDPATGTVYVADSGNRRIDQFTAWGVFVKAWGWGVATNANELEQCTVSCRQGIAGSGAGQFGGESPFGVAVDSTGAVYVVDSANRRVEKFNSSGDFLLMFGGEVNKTTGADVCTAASEDQCGSGVSGTGPGEFTAASALAVGSDGTVYVGDTERVQKFDSGGSFLGEITLASAPDGTHPGQKGVPGTTVAHALAVDPTSSAIYVGRRHLIEGGDGSIGSAFEEDVLKFDPAGELVATLPVFNPKAISVGADGTVYVVDETHPVPGTILPNRVLQFTSAGADLPSCCAPDFADPQHEFELAGLGTNTAGDLYVSTSFLGSGSYVTLYGPPPLGFGNPPAVPPTIIDQFSFAVSAHSAELNAHINPHFWADARYYVEYGTGICSQGGCPTKQPLPPGTDLGGGHVNKAVAAAPLALAGLSPRTTYRFRFVAESGGGGPVFGLDPDGEGPGEATFADGLERTFTTFPEDQPAGACANDAFRTGRAAPLYDCRAYEMVSPIDKEGGDILGLIDITGFETRLNQAAVDGDAVSYSSYRAFASPASAPYTSQYLARRGPNGWATEGLEALRGHSFYAITFSAENPFKAFSANLCQSWLVRDSEPVLDPAAPPGFPTIYRRGNCPGTYEAVSTTAPPSVPASEYLPELQGVSGDGSKAIFRVNDKLTPEAADGGAYQLYEATGGALRLVCVLPDGSPFAGNCTAGTQAMATAGFVNRTTTVAHAVSNDGSRIFWTASAGASEPGKIYVRLNGAETRKVSETESTLKSRFWDAATDGSRALFEVTEGPKEGNLYLYSLEDEASSLIAGEVLGVAAASENLSHVYFVSEEAMGGSGLAGEPNLYLHSAEGNAFVATLSREDAPPLTTEIPNNIATLPLFHAASTTPDGSRLAFISTQPLTGADNIDAASSEADSEVFTYDAASGKVACASCSPAGARPHGPLLRGTGNSPAKLPTAASIPAFENQLYQPRSLSADGSRLFFTSYADLLPHDTNGKADVYEWERAGTAGCTGEAGAAYSAANGGCLYLVSSGRSSEDSEFVDSGASGRDVFFSTEESLLPQDPGLIDIYDAREGGGLPAPPGPELQCSGGEDCQPAQQVPAVSAPATGAAGPGNAKSKLRCPRGKHAVGVKKKGRTGKRKASRSKKTTGRRRCVVTKHHRTHKHHSGKKRAGHNGTRSHR